METDDLFHSSSRRIAEFSEIQVRLYRHNIRLQDYFMQLQLGISTSSIVSSRHQRPANPLLGLAIRSAEKFGRLLSRRKYKTDVLFCPTPYFDRRTENRLTIRTLLGLAQTDAKILCLMEAGAPFRKELDTQLAAVGRANQVEFVDPTASLNMIDARLRVRTARMRAWSTLQEVAGILGLDTLNLARQTQSGFEHTAYYVDAWEALAPSVDFETVITRCHWNTVCSSVCRTAQERGKQAITFQQGVIGHTLDVPVTANKYVAFGQSSASFLARVNSRFFHATGMPQPPVKYVQSGCIIDKVNVLRDQFDLKTLLMVDVQVNPGDFYGIANQCQALLRLAEKLLAADLPLRRLIIRPHPYWSDLDIESVQSLVREHSARCELSHPAWSLEDDLLRSSAAVGIFSGVLTVASASGLPTFFLKTEEGFMTEDLACFSEGQTLLPEDAFREISKILTDQRAYADAREIALHNAREYYANGTNMDFNASFFERLLRNEATPNHPEQVL
jgi:hypothetical protein